MKPIKQLVTRRRRLGDEQLEYPDCYDEYMGRESTGRIVDIAGNVIVDNNIKKEKEEEVKKDVYDNYYIITVIHEYGENIIGKYPEDEFLQLNIPEYKNSLNAKYWDNFVKEIKIEDIEVKRR